MKTIEIFEKARKSENNLRKAGIIPTLYWAYVRSRETGNENIDFDYEFSDGDIQPIAEAMRDLGIKVFTISCRRESIVDAVAEFEKYGFRPVGLAKVKSSARDSFTGDYEVVAAIKMTL